MELPAVPGRDRLSSIQALRGTASVAVVLYHAARHVNKGVGAPSLARLLQSGHAGVDLFFVISGFIILFVHQADIGRPGRLAHYANRRFSRVLPLYWVAFAASLAMLAIGHGLPPAGWVAWCATLLPTVGEPIMGHAWTLQYEIVFYGVFAVLILSRSAGTLLLAAWLGWIAITEAGVAWQAVPSALCGAYGLEFFLGMAAALAVRRGVAPRPPLLALAGGALFATAMILETFRLLDGQAAYARLAFGMPAALLVGGLAAWERATPMALPAWLLALGQASYSIYLFQFIFIGVAWQLLLKVHLTHLPPGLCFVLLAAGATAGGLLCSRLIERPLLAWSKESKQSFFEKKDQKTFIS